MSTHLTPRPVIAVDELKRAWHAVQTGQFRSDRPSVPARNVTPTGPARPRTGRVRPSWEPDERVLPVIGALGGAGATTTALTIATANTAPSSGQSRVIECCSATASGLPAAAAAELGTTPTGWVRGSREQVLIERAATAMGSVAEVPPPAAPARPPELTVLDIGWEIGHVLATDSWVRDQVRQAPWLVVVATATIPGMRRLEGALSLLDDAQVVAVVRGPSRKKWPREVGPTMGARTCSLDQSGLLIDWPHDPGLSIRGLDPHHLLPPRLLAAATALLRLTEAGTVTKGHAPS